MKGLLLFLAVLIAFLLPAILDNCVNTNLEPAATAADCGGGACAVAKAVLKCPGAVASKAKVVAGRAVTITKSVVKVVPHRNAANERRRLLPNRPLRRVFGRLFRPG